MRGMDHSFNKLLTRIEELERVVNNQARKINDTFREAKVVEVYPDEGVVEIEAYGEGSKTKKVPWLMQAGGINDFVPPSKGQRVMLVSPSGEAGKSFVMPGGYSDQYPQPHDKGDEAFRKIGDTTDLMTGGKRRIVAAEIELVGNVRISGGVLEHEGRNVGHDHKHTEVIKGGDLTGPPEA